MSNPLGKVFEELFSPPSQERREQPEKEQRTPCAKRKFHQRGGSRLLCRERRAVERGHAGTPWGGGGTGQRNLMPGSQSNVLHVRLTGTLCRPRSDLPVPGLGALLRGGQMSGGALESRGKECGGPLGRRWEEHKAQPSPGRSTKPIDAGVSSSTAGAEDGTGAPVGVAVRVGGPPEVEQEVRRGVPMPPQHRHPGQPPGPTIRIRSDRPWSRAGRPQQTPNRRPRRWGATLERRDSRGVSMSSLPDPPAEARMGWDPGHGTQPVCGSQPVGPRTPMVESRECPKVQSPPLDTLQQ